jgi:hypothetical protein
MLLKPKISNRKFYNKWLYKVSLRVPGSFIFRRYPLADIASISSSQLDKDLSIFLAAQDPGSFALRAEFNILDIYINDPDLQQTILRVFERSVRHYSLPSERVLNNQHDEKVIFAKKYAHNRYKYKVFLHPHKITNKEDKIQYLNWLNTQGDKIRISDAVKTWFIITNWNWDRRYMYVEDEQTLLMLKLRSGESIGPIYKIEIPINT